MQKVNRLQGKWWQSVLFFITALLIVVADQLSKIWIRANLAIGQSIFEAGFFRLTRVHNTGAAFGLFQGQSFALTVVAFVGVGVLLFYAFLIYRHFPLFNSKLGKSALGLVLGGTVGNLIDRIRFGHVTDFIDFGFWPAFNIADSAVVVGAILLAYLLIRSVKSSEHSDEQSI